MNQVTCKLFVFSFCFLMHNSTFSQMTFNETKCEVNSISYWIPNQPETTKQEDVAVVFGKKYKKVDIDSNNTDIIYKKKGLIFHFYSKSLSSFEIIPEFFKGKTGMGLQLGKKLKVEDLLSIYDFNSLRVDYTNEYCWLHLAKGNNSMYGCSIIFCIKLTDSLKAKRNLKLEEFISFFTNTTEGKNYFIERIRINQSVNIGSMGF